jgi:hypothetical protein
MIVEAMERRKPLHYDDYANELRPGNHLIDMIGEAVAVRWIEWLLGPSTSFAAGAGCFNPRRILDE